MIKKSLYVAILVALAVPAGMYVAEHLQSDINAEINQQPPAAGAVSRNWKPGQILVKPKAGLPDAEFDKMLKQNNGKVAEKIGNLAVHIISVPDNAEEAVVRALSKNPHIEFAELDIAAEIVATTPNDPKYASAWHLPKIQSPNAWDISRADGITIAILDTGVDSAHPDLADKMLPGWNAVDGSSATDDLNGHGTAVAGTAAAVTNNAVGVSGVAWNAKVLPIRISNTSDGYAYWSDIARGLSWAADNGADVANISYEAHQSSSIASAAQYMRNKGGVVVNAAGNSGIDTGYADVASLITVSATTSTDTKASWSNYGAVIDVAAPGASILTTNRGGSYGSWNGTSFSSPVTAGVVALIMSSNSSLTPDDVEKVLQNSAAKVAGVDFHPYYGFGRIDAAAAVQLAVNTTVSDTEAPNVAVFSPSTGTVVKGLVQVDVSAADNVSVSEVAFYANGNLVGTDGTSPYQFSWDTASVADGNVSLTATATDAAGNQGASMAVTVQVQNQIAQVVADQSAPTVEILDPFSNATVSGLVTISVSANDDVAVSKVDLYIDNKLVSSSSSQTLNYKWNTKKVSAGSHTIQAVATDTANKTGNMTIQVKK